MDGDEDGDGDNDGVGGTDDRLDRGAEGCMIFHLGQSRKARCPRSGC